MIIATTTTIATTTKHIPAVVVNHDNNKYPRKN